LTEPRHAARTTHRPPPGSSSRPLELRLAGPVEPADVEVLCTTVRDAAATSATGDVRCNVAAVGAGDLGAINGLARLALAAHRAGGHLRLDDSTPELRDLIRFVGLDRVLPCAPAASPAGAQAGSPAQASAMGLPSASSRSGSPKSGKKRAVSRKNVTPDSRSPSRSRTWSDQGS